MLKHIPITKPIATQGTAFWKNGWPRRPPKLDRYIKCLSLFSQIDKRHQRFLLSELPHEIEFRELLAEGLVSGKISKTVNADKETHPNTPNGYDVIENPSITVSGALKLAKLSDYQWNTSVLGSFWNGFGHAAWILFGAVIGAMFAR